GVSALTRATALLLLPVHLVWLRSNRALSLAAAAVMLLAAIVVYSPWPFRNSLILGELTLGSSETSEWLWRGNNPNADGNSLTSAGKRMIEVAPVAFREEVMNATEAQ